jgi:hypothetical protein
MQKDIRNYTITVSKNSLDCWGIGMEYYALFEFITDSVPRIDARVIRFDLIFASINITRYPRMEWRE